MLRSVAKPEVQYLGYVIGCGVIHPQVGKVEEISGSPLPNTKKRLKSFLQLVGWYRLLIPNFSSRLAVLTDKTRKSSPVKVKWTPESENAFNDLKSCFCQEPVLQCPDFTLLFTVQTDEELCYCKVRVRTRCPCGISARNSFPGK